MIFEREITFDRFARILMCTALAVAIFAVVYHLRTVLLPFVVAWLLAYLAYPLVQFVQFRMHVPTRMLSIIVSLIIIVAVLTGVVWLIIPPMFSQVGKLMELLVHYVQTKSGIVDIPAEARKWISANQHELTQIFRDDNVLNIIKDSFSRIFEFAGKAYSAAMGGVAVIMTLMYMFFILLDYEYLTKAWIKIFPERNRAFWQELAGEVKHQLNSYIRGQALVALIMGVLFCIGFSIIGFPMAIGLGLLIGLLDLVPYLHAVALVPTIFLAGLKAADTGDNFWFILLTALAVFGIVQVIIDMYVVPKIMGKAMGLNPAVLLLALSVWGAILGFMGLILALPLTTILFAYYKRYVTNDTPLHHPIAPPEPSE